MEQTWTLTHNTTSKIHMKNHDIHTHNFTFYNTALLILNNLTYN